MDSPHTQKCNLRSFDHIPANDITLFHRPTGGGNVPRHTGTPIKGSEERDRYQVNVDVNDAVLKMFSNNKQKKSAFHCKYK